MQTSNLLELVKQSEKLLTGKVPVTTDDDFEQAWLHIWRKTSNILEQRIDSDAATAEVVVCGNTHVICKKLASLRDSGFRRTPGDPPSSYTLIYTIYIYILLQPYCNQHLPADPLQRPVTPLPLTL